MNEPNPTPAFRLGCGSIVCGYRLVRCVGRGWESTSYLAHEEHSGVVRRLKFFRPGDDFLPQQIGHIAATFERLASTGAVPAYHHMRVWQRGRQDTPFLVFGYIEGIPLTKLLEPGRWRRGWTDRKAVRVLRAIAAKLGAVHAGGLGIGDFASGNNILVTGEDDVIWCDIDAACPRARTYICTRLPGW